MSVLNSRFAYENAKGVLHQLEKNGLHKDVNRPSQLRNWYDGLLAGIFLFFQDKLETIQPMGLGEFLLIEVLFQLSYIVDVLQLPPSLHTPSLAAGRPVLDTCGVFSTGASHGSNAIVTSHSQGSIAHTPCKRTCHEVHEGERPSQRPHRQRPYASFLSPASETFQATAHVNSSTLPGQPIVSQRPPLHVMVDASTSAIREPPVSPLQMSASGRRTKGRAFPMYDERPSQWRRRQAPDVPFCASSSERCHTPTHGTSSMPQVYPFAPTPSFATRPTPMSEHGASSSSNAPPPLLPHPQHQLMLAEHHFDIELTWTSRFHIPREVYIARKTGSCNYAACVIRSPNLTADTVTSPSLSACVDTTPNLTVSSSDLTACFLSAHLTAYIVVTSPDITVCAVTSPIITVLVTTGNLNVSAVTRGDLTACVVESANLTACVVDTSHDIAVLVVTSGNLTVTSSNLTACVVKRPNLTTVQTQQRAERDAAIARLEQSRIVLALRLADHHGKKYKVIEEARAFVGEVQNHGKFVPPENGYTSAESYNGGKSSNILVKVVISSFNFAKKSLKVDHLGGVLGNAALFAVSMLALLHLHQVNDRDRYISDLQQIHEVNNRLNKNVTKVYLPEGGSTNGLDVLSARG
ncbi:plastid division1 [Artemisia annua]|uniref:Plastid division1 n=1 Tax=Artemisia annua TaxID=35608 RepID=A0A2U1LEI1_ARTAN|nr:plastid division1 [Artemisia annua]